MRFVEASDVCLVKGLVKTVVCKIARAEQTHPVTGIPFEEKIRMFGNALQGLDNWEDLIIIYQPRKQNPNDQGTNEGDLYVVKNGRPDQLGNLQRRLPGQLSRLNGFHIEVEWVRPFNHCLQRRFLLGDISVSPEDVETACQNQDWEPLSRLLPRAEVVYDSLRLVEECLQRKMLRAIKDCEHEWTVDDSEKTRPLQECSRCQKMCDVLFRCETKQGDEERQDGCEGEDTEKEILDEGCGAKDVCLECCTDEDDEESAKENERYQLKIMEQARRKGFGNGSVLVHMPTAHNEPFEVKMPKGMSMSEKLE